MSEESGDWPGAFSRDFSGLAGESANRMMTIDGWRMSDGGEVGRHNERKMGFRSIPHRSIHYSAPLHHCLPVFRLSSRLGVTATDFDRGDSLGSLWSVCKSPSLFLKVSVEIFLSLLCLPLKCFL
ncbi:hypothetical protein DdX_13348 [Ditylenchus destructor]|uniref:Uncharacterized protein n=1 Tax=Ditylenchus destructor TaxID=166010 RepID=A0AAD4MUS1_9BILA|nr:hypothetical protein DdX_13348 [Ditylenchus destructor]